MVKPKIVILRGTMASGKSTAYNSIKYRKEMKEWFFFDFPKIKTMFDNLNDEDRRKFGKIVLLSGLSELIKTKRNIFVEEISRARLEENLGEEIRKNKYEIIVFEFDVSAETSYLRNVERRKRKEDLPRKRKDMENARDKRQPFIDKNAIFINTENLTKTQVVNRILKELNLK